MNGLYNEFVENHIEQSFWGFIKASGQVITLYYSFSYIFEIKQKYTTVLS